METSSSGQLPRNIKHFAYLPTKTKSIRDTNEGEVQLHG